MLTKKSIGIALACALALGASGAAFATTITVDGITWDPAAGSDLTIQALNFRESAVGAVGNVLTGYGQIGSINGDTSFCSGCTLDFTFQYTVSNIGGTATNPKVVFNLGSISFFDDPAGGFKVSDPTSVTGTPWLTLTGHTFAFTGFTTADPTTLGQLYATINGPVGDPGTLSAGFGLLDATGGPAASFMDTNSQSDGADLSLSSAFNFFPDSSCTSVSADPTSICHYPIVGTGTLTGRSVTVPEPGALGLMGLGLAALGFLVQRRRKEADERA